MAEIRVRRELRGGASLEQLRNLVGQPRPVSVRRLIDVFNEPLTFSEPLVTGDGVALGGHQQITLHRDGRWTFEGHFRATGWPSYRVSVATRLEGSNGTVVGFAAQGEVHGTNEPGGREHRFTQEGQNGLVAQRWPDLRHARIHHDLQYDADFFGTPGEILAFVGKFAAASTALGGAGVVIVLGSEGIDRFGGQELALPGLVGVMVASGVLLVFGPSVLIPAVIAGAAVGAGVADAVDQRPMDHRERDFADLVYGGSIPWDRVLLTNLLGVGDRPFTTPGPANTILVNIGQGVRDPVAYQGNGRAEMDGGKPIQARGQLLMHELGHAWQIAHSEFIPGLMCTGIFNQVGTLGGNMDVYKYATPNQNWDDYNLEQQASIIDDWYAGDMVVGTKTGSSQQSRFPARSAAEPPDPAANPYWRFIRDHVRPGVR